MRPFLATDLSIWESDSAFARQFIADFCTRARETRKWNIAMALYTQFFDDLPKDIVNLLTSVYVFGAGTTSSIDELCDTYSLPAVVKNSITAIAKPGKGGAAMFVYYKTDIGVVYQMVMSTLGKRILWAYSSTSEDVYVRNKLYQEFGVSATLNILSILHPAGSIKELAAERQIRYSAEGKNVSALDELVEEAKAWMVKTRIQQISETQS